MKIEIYSKIKKHIMYIKIYNKYIIKHITNMKYIIKIKLYII